MEKEKVTSDTILNYLKGLVESKKLIPREEWLNCAFRLNLLEIDENILLRVMQQKVAQKKLEILKSQQKRNVAAAELEVEATDEYRFMKDQEDKIDAVKEFVMIAKKSSDY